MSAISVSFTRNSPSALCFAQKNSLPGYKISNNVKKAALMNNKICDIELLFITSSSDEFKWWFGQISPGASMSPQEVFKVLKMVPCLKL